MESSIARLCIDACTGTFMVGGAIDINGILLHAGDGAAVDDEKLLAITANQSSEFLLFDLA